MCSQESTIEEVGCGGNEDVKMDECLSTVANMDIIRNESIRGTTNVGEVSKEVQESRLKWCGHVFKRQEEHKGKRVMVMGVSRNRSR